MPPTSLLHRNSSYAGNLGGVELPAAPGSVTQFDAVGSLISPMSQQIPPTDDEEVEQLLMETGSSASIPAKGTTRRPGPRRRRCSPCCHWGAALAPHAAVPMLIVVLVTVALITGCTEEAPLISNDAVVLGLLLAVLHTVFETSSHPHWALKRFYKFVPSLLLCYFIPGILGSTGVISGSKSHLPAVASQYLLPACLTLLTLGTNVSAIARLGKKAVSMFAIGALGVMVGGPLAILIVKIFHKPAIGSDTWKGLACIAGSWIGGSANQLAMKEVFDVPEKMFSQAVAVDVFVSNIWMAILLAAADHSAAIDRWLRADTEAIAELSQRLEESALESARIPTFRDFVALSYVAFGTTGLSTFLGSAMSNLVAAHAPVLKKLSLASPFFWLVLLAGIVGLVLSFTPLRRLEGAGASKIGSVLLYVMIATIGMKMDLRSLTEAPGMIGLGLIWISIHAMFMIAGAFVLRSPVFFLAVGSQANIGGAASAPVVAAAFNPSLATMGVLLAVLGYSTGTALAWVSAVVMRWVSA